MNFTMQGNITDPFNFPFIVLGNKVDKFFERRVSEQAARRWCESNNIPYLQVSAKDGTNVNDAFEVSCSI